MHRKLNDKIGRLKVYEITVDNSGNDNMEPV
jgi:hypothetical protein